MKKIIAHHPPAHPHPQSKSAKNISIFVRNNKKQALLLHTPSHTYLNNITRVIAKRLRVPHQEQVLFLNGRQLSPSSHSELELTDGDVIHLVDRRNIRQ